MNAYQRRCAETYLDGEHAWIVEEAREQDSWIDLVASTRDNLFRFVMQELSDVEGCNSRDEAVRRLERIMVTIDTVMMAL